MARLFCGTLALATIVAVPSALWAEDKNRDLEIIGSVVVRLRKGVDADDHKPVAIAVHVDEGAVWIEGNVTTPTQRTSILEIARRVPGVRVVVNDLKVVSSDGSPQPVKLPDSPVIPASAEIAAPASPDFAWLSQREKTAIHIRQAILSEKEAGRVTGFDVVVRVSLGRVVLLEGRCANEPTREALVGIIRGQPRVRQVTDSTEIAEEGTHLSDRATCYVSGFSNSELKRVLRWNNGWTDSDFQADEDAFAPE